MAAPAAKALREELFLPKRPTQVDYDDMVRKRRRELRLITEQLARRDMTPRDWADRFDAILYTGHSRAWFLGRGLSGDLRDFGADDRLAGIAAKDKDSEFLQAFQDALDAKDPKYYDADGLLRQSAVMNRANLYLGRMRGTAGEAFVAASSDEDLFDWILGATEKHCDDCPALAALSPYTKDTLFSYPGDGDTECLGNCRCYLRRRRDRLASFKPEGSLGKTTATSPDDGTAPVSDAFDVNASYPASSKIREAIGAIDSVHTDGVLPEINVETAVLSPDQGGWFDPNNSEIVLNAAFNEPIGTMIHEVGHVLDMHGIGVSGKMSSPRAQVLKPWRDAVKGTESFKRIQAIKNGEKFLVDGNEITPSSGMIEHAEYLNKWEEFWARSYFQFVYKRSTSAALSIEVLDLLNSWYQKTFLAQWDEKDFGAVEKAIEAVFIDLGWIVK